MTVTTSDATAPTPRPGGGLTLTLPIAAPPGPILAAFFDPQALARWWQVVRAITVPCSLGAYAIEWAPTEFRDDLLGRLGGVFHGTVMQFDAGRGFFVADAYWNPPDGEPVGPMALDVSCGPIDSRSWSRLRRPGTNDAGTLLRVVQSGYEESPRWRRYYDVVGGGWPRALESLKAHVEG
ncbi:MAG TPA: SRPBCC domain-containing protein [Vicinamibacterales bacterium]